MSDQTPTTLTADAKAYWRDRGIRPYYHKWGPLRQAIVDTVRYLPKRETIHTVLEFGCNVGRTLAGLQETLPDLTVQGIDVNADAVAAGKAEYGVDLHTGDEDTLAIFPEHAFDITYTVSVLDHLPVPLPALQELHRITRQYFIAIEPDSQGIEDTGVIASAYTDVPYSYLWHYPLLLSAAGFRILAWYDLPIGTENLQPYYRLYVCRKER